MGRKLKAILTLALVALLAGGIVGVFAGTASVARGSTAAPAPPPGGCGTSSDEDGGSTCPATPTPAPASGATTTTTTTTTTSGTGTGTTTTGSVPTVNAPVVATVQSTTPGSSPKAKGVTTPVNVVIPSMSTSTPAPAPANGPALTTLPKTISTGAVASIHRARIHARIHHSRKHHNKPVKRHHHKAIVAPPPPPKITPPASGPKLPAGVKVTSSVATPSAVRFKATYVLAAALLGGFLILLLAFPAELFNKTYEENEEEIHVVFTRMGLERHHLSRWVGYLVYILVGAGLSVWLALQEGSDGNGLAVAVGLIVALPLVTFAFEFPAELYLRTRSKIPGQLRVLPTALLVGAVCAVISRAIHLEPAYLYGIFAGYTAMRADALAEEEEGKSVMVGVTVLFLVAGISWFAWGALNGQAHGLHRDWFVIIVSTSFFWIFVLAAEGLVFGLIPLKYMDGAALRGWRTIAWLVPQLLAAAFFIYVQMLDGDTRKIHTFSDVIKPFIVFAGFGLLSFAFWGYFQWKGRPSAKHGGDGGEHGEEIPAAPPVVAAPAAPAVAGVELLTFVLPTRPGDSPPPGQDG